jgi:hypothetical protein
MRDDEEGGADRHPSGGVDAGEGTVVHEPQSALAYSPDGTEATMRGIAVTHPAPASSVRLPPGIAVADPADQARHLRLVGLAATGFALAGSALELGVLCPLRRLTGVPCPLCGLTTGTWALAHGDVAAAVHAHPMAPAALAFLVLAWTPWGPAAVSAVRRRPAALAVLLCLVWTARLAGLYGS